jgi:hypothetical protein
MDLRAPAGGGSPGSRARRVHLLEDAALATAAGFGDVWDRICRHAGATFTLPRAQQFTYEMIGNNVLPVGRQRQLHKGNFARAHARMPLRATTDIKDVQGSSHVFAILTDKRISGNP